MPALLKTSLIENALNSSFMVETLKRTVPPTDKLLMKVSRGWANLGFQTVALVTTVGAKSGQSRAITTLCMPVGDSIVLVGSNWGQDRHPGWIFNLRANPQAQVSFRGYVGPMVATELDGEARSVMWDELIAYNPQYQRYQEGTARQLPVMLLRKAEAAAA